MLVKFLNRYAKEGTNIAQVGAHFGQELELIIKCSFKEIYLLGADYLSDPPIFGHFYDGFDEVGKASDYESYRERAFWMIDHVQNRGCKVINVIKDNNQTSIIKSITFQDLE